MKLLAILEKLCACDGVSGREEAIRQAILEIIGDHAEVRQDALGNLLVFKAGMRPAQKKVLLCAHMDEVGFIVTGATEEGYLRFHPVGGLDPRAVIGRRVRFEQGPYGVIGITPVHLIKPEEKHSVPDFEGMYMDIGASNAEEATTLIPPGSVAVFDSEYGHLGGDILRGKALDDRAGCAILLDMIGKEQETDLYFAFTVQEEVGARGARTAAFALEPEFALVAETTTAADIAGVEEEKQVCCLHAGPVVSFMDRSTLYDRSLYEAAFAIGAHSGIPVQAKQAVAGGNDAGAVHLSREGVRTLALSLPCRYLHTAHCVISQTDLTHTRNLMEAMAVAIASGQVL